MPLLLDSNIQYTNTKLYVLILTQSRKEGERNQGSLDAFSRVTIEIKAHSSRGNMKLQEGHDYFMCFSIWHQAKPLAATGVSAGCAAMLVLTCLAWSASSCSAAGSKWVVDEQVTIMSTDISISMRTLAFLQQ